MRSFEVSEVKLKHMRLQKDVREIHKKGADQKTATKERKREIPVVDNPTRARGPSCDTQCHAPVKSKCLASFYSLL